MLPKAKPALRSHAKGSLLLNLRAFVVEKKGMFGWHSLIEPLSPADRGVLEGMVLTAGWYPIGTWNHLVDEYLSGVEDPVQEMIDFSRFTAQHDLNFLFKALLRMGTPSLLLSRTDSLWQRYYDAGEFTPRQVGPREFALTLAAPADIELAAGPWICNQAVVGWLTQALLMTGAKTPQIEHLRCRFEGASQCEYRARW